MSTRVLEARERRKFGRPPSIYRGKNNYKWKVKKPERTSDRFNADVLPGPTNDATNASTIEEFFDILFSPDIVEDIVKFTNLQIEKEIVSLIEKESVEQSYHHLTDVSKIRAYLNVSYYSGLKSDSKVSDCELWSPFRETSFYRCVFPLQRWNFLASYLRFDDRVTRDEQDKFAPIRSIFDKFINNCNCKNNYSTSSYCTVDDSYWVFEIGALSELT